MDETLLRWWEHSVLTTFPSSLILLFTLEPPINATVTLANRVFNETRFNNTSFKTTQIICNWNQRRVAPFPSVLWTISLLNGTTYNATGRVYNIPLQRNYTGTYRCTLTNKAGSMAVSTQILIQCKFFAAFWPCACTRSFSSRKSSSLQKVPRRDGHHSPRGLPNLSIERDLLIA